MPLASDRFTELPAPDVAYIGPAAIWWIPKPRGPRFSVTRAALAWVLLLPVTAGTLLWLDWRSDSLWPFYRPLNSPAEILWRYELTILICAAYITLYSIPAWVRYRRFARGDALAVDRAIRQEQWEDAALLLHRYCLFISGLWRRIPARATAWDGILRNRLPRHRRVYVYYDGAPPRLPQDVTASFTPAVVPPPQPSLWSAAALLPIGFLLYLLVLDIAQQGRPERLILVNAVLLVFVLVSYGVYFLLRLLGRSYYFRFAPGIVQWVHFRLGRKLPIVESLDLRRIHVVLDLSTRWPTMTLLDAPGGRRETFRLPRNADALEAFFRAALSTAPSPPLPEEQLVG